MSRGSAGLGGAHLVGPKGSQAPSVGDPPGSGTAQAGTQDSPAGTDNPTLAQTAQTVRTAWRSWRNRLLAQPGFRHWAAGFWPTRVQARREAAQLFDLVAGFAYSQVLLACVRSGLLRALADRPLDAQTLAHHCALPLPGMQRLLEAAAALRLVERDGALWTCGPLGIVLATEPAIEAMVLHHEALYEDLRDPLALLRATPGAPGVQATGLRRYWPYAGLAPARGLGDDQVAPYSLLMSASQPLVAAQVLDAVDLRGHRCLMDVGGGEGGFLAAVAERHPQMRLILLDLPAVARRADRALRAKGLVARTVGADFRSDRLPVGADLVSLVRVLHDHDDAVVLDLLGRVHAALGPGGRLLVAEPLADTPGARAMGDAYFGMYLWAMGAGRPRSAARLAEMLRARGFSDVRQLPTRQPLQCGLLSAWV